MNWQNLYQQQLYKNQELKKQLEIVEFGAGGTHTYVLARMDGTRANPNRF